MSILECNQHLLNLLDIWFLLEKFLYVDEDIQNPAYMVAHALEENPANIYMTKFPVIAVRAFIIIAKLSPSPSSQLN